MEAGDGVTTLFDPQTPSGPVWIKVSSGWAQEFPLTTAAAGGRVVVVDRCKYFSMGSRVIWGLRAVSLWHKPPTTANPEFQGQTSLEQDHNLSQSEQSIWMSLDQ